VEESELYRILRNAQFVLDMDEFQIHEPLRLESLKFIMALIKNACDKTTPHARISVLFDQGPYHYSAIGGYLFDALEELFQIGDGGFSSDNYRHFIEFYDRHKNNPRIIKQLENYVAFANDLRSYPGVSDSAEEAYDSLTLGFISAVRSDLPAYLYRYSNQLSLDKFCWVIREQLNQGNLSEKMILDIVTLIKYSGLELSKDYIVNANFILSYFRGNNRLARFVAGINRSVAHAPHKYFIDVSPHNQPTYLSLELKKILRDPRNMRLDFYRAYSAIGLNVLLRQKRMIGENYNLPSEIVGRLVNKNIYHSRNIRYINAILPLNTTLPYGDNEYRGEYFKLIYSILQDHQLTDESQFIRTLLASNTYIVTTGVRITRINDEDLKQIKKLIKGKKILVDNRMTRAYLDKTLGPWRVRLLAGDTINRYHHICKSSKINPYSIEATATGELVVLLNSFSAINTLENSEALKSVTRLALMYKLRNKFNLDHEALIHLTKIIGENKRGAQLDRLWNKLFYPKRKNNFFANSFMRYFISSKGRIRNNRDDIAGLYTLVHPSFSPFSAIDDFVEEIFRHIDVKRSDSVKAIVNFAKELNLLGIKHIRYLSQLVAVTNAIDNHSDLATTIGWLQNNFVIDSTLISAPSEYGTLSFMKRSILHAVESNLDHRDYLTRHYAVDANMTDRLNAERSSGEANIIKDTDSSIRNTLKKYLTKYSPSKYLIGNNSGSSQTTNRAIDNSINRRSRV
jgi:hypothetical protein